VTDKYMEKKRLGYTDLYLTRVGIGTWAIGGDKWDWGWGKQDDARSINAIRQAVDLGVNWVDTAPVYGLGHAEEVVARAVDGPTQVIIATKCGNLWMEGKTNAYKDLKAQSIIQHVDDTLKRLRVEVIDLLQIHWPNEDLEEGWGALAQLVKLGKIRYAGVCNCSLEQLKCLQPILPVASLQNPYSMIERDLENNLLSYCVDNQIGVLAHSPLQNGLLTGKYTLEKGLTDLAFNDWRRRDSHFRQPGFRANIELVDGLRPIARQLGITLTGLAIAWVLRRTEVTAVIVGLRDPQHSLEAVSGSEVHLMPEILAEIETILQEHQRKVENLKDI
jgi:aryl-alcohol dehydrogenase-like predicted oxidoreductase